ncbi:MAG: DUF4105 domain-containing protein [Flavobacterium sp.]
MKKNLLFFLMYVFGCLSTMNGQNITLSDQAQISILTCGNGDQLYSIFGHTALRIYDPVYDLDIVYNYGTFDFAAPNFYLKFIKGDLQYFISTSRFDHFLYAYEIDNRDVWEQVIYLQPQQKQELFHRLQNAINSQERYYTYKFIDRNCTTMVVDQLNTTFGEPIIQKVGNVEESYRHVINPFLENLFFEKLGINIIFGHRPDEAALQLFLPIEFLESLKVAELKGKPVAGQVIIHNQQDAELLKSPWWNSMYVLLGFLLVVIMTRNTKIYLGFLIFCGSLGIFLLGVGLFSEHREVLWNYNALLFNPLLIVMAFAYWKRKQKLFMNIRNIIIMVGLVYFIYLMNKAHFWMMLPIGLTIWILLRQLNLRIKKVIVL